jgi:hypothetical protein
MRRLLIDLVVVAAAASSLTMVGFGAVHADTMCQRTDPATGLCLIWVEVPGTPGEPGNPGEGGPKDTGAGASCYWDGTKLGLSNPPPGPVPCSSEAGYWSNDYNCYISLVAPQPAAGDPSWQGHDAGDGAVYQCYQPQTALLVWIWSQGPPPNSGAGPTPGEVAHLAIKDMNLTAINIGIAPEPGSDSIGLVGMPVWMWATNPDDHTYGPVTASASAGGITVTATARVLKLTWLMGDGTKVVCHTAGTPYQPSYGMQESPDCGHIYTKSSSHEEDERFTVTAISDWVVTWAGAGQSGTIRLNGLQRSVEVAIGEAQVLVQ